MTIRRQPEDFRVEEVLTGTTLQTLAPDWSRAHPHAVYRVTKTSLTTPEAASRLAGALGVRWAMVEYAGLKDKHAVTRQHLGVRAESEDDARSMPERVEARGLVAERIGWSSAALDASAIACNRFEIVVRDLTRERARRMGDRADALCVEDSTGLSLQIVNYFGDQRFGSARHGAGFVAASLVRGDFEQALRLAIGTPARKDTGAKRIFTRELASRWGQWKRLARELPGCPERAAIESLAQGLGFDRAFASLPHFLQQMCVEAYQSHLWNRIAASLAREIAQKADVQTIDADDDFGVMAFVRPGAVDERSRSIEIPTLGPATRLVPPWGAHAERVLRDEGLRLDQLQIPGLRRPEFGEAPRPLFVRASQFDMSVAQADEFDERGLRGKRSVRFELPRGAYATVVLRALGE